MQFHFYANQSHFHKNGFALRLALKQRHKGTRKWPLGLSGLPGASVSNRVLVQNISYEDEFDLHEIEHVGRKRQLRNELFEDEPTFRPLLYRTLINTTHDRNNHQASS